MADMGLSKIAIKSPMNIGQELSKELWHFKRVPQNNSKKAGLKVTAKLFNIQASEVEVTAFE